MKEIAEQAEQSAKEMQMIVDNLAGYNPGLCKKRIPLPVIQHNIAVLARELALLYKNIGKKIK